LALQNQRKTETKFYFRNFSLYTEAIIPMKLAGCNAYKGFAMSKDMTKRKDVLTTGQVAQICNVAPRTVTKWFDSGQLRGYRIPGSRDRRIPATELIRFMKAHNIPTTLLEAGRLKVLIIDDNPENVTNFASALAKQANYDVETANNGFDAGVVAQRFAPHVVLINLLSSGIDAGQICKNIRTNNDLTGTKVVAFADHLMNKSETAALIEKGFDSVLSKNGDIGHIIEVIEETTAVLY
jgi:excisionase family DNA binding protein